MLIEVVRDIFTPLSTSSQVLIDGQFFCFGMEPPQRDEKPRAIPAGEYEVVLQYSAHFAQLTPHVQNVPGFTAIEIHPGNYPRSTEGCLLVGRTRADDYVGESITAFEGLRERMKSAQLRGVKEAVKIVYRNRDSNAS